MSRPIPRETRMYYKSFHDSLSELTGYPPNLVQSIRRVYFLLKDSKQVAFHYVQLMQKPKDQRRHPVERYQAIVNIVASCPQEIWEVLVQPDDLQR